VGAVAGLFFPIVFNRVAMVHSNTVKNDGKEQSGNSPHMGQVLRLIWTWLMDGYNLNVIE